MNDETQIETLEVQDESSIIARINELHAKAESLAKSAKDTASEAIFAAIECGKFLNIRRKITGHGDWITWVESNCNFTRRTATNYINLFRKFSDKDVSLPDSSNGKHVSHL